jgi:hypothetical protein
MKVIYLTALGAYFVMPFGGTDCCKVFLYESYLPHSGRGSDTLPIFFFI